MSPLEEKSFTPLLSEEELDALIQGYNSRGSERYDVGGGVMKWAVALLVTFGAAWWWWS